MKYLSLLLGISGLIIGSLALYLGKKSDVRLAYVDSTEVLNAYEGMLDLRKEMRLAEKKETAKLDTLVGEFKKALTDYDQSKSTMSAGEIKLKEELLNLKRQQVAGYQQSVKEKLREKELDLTRSLVADMNSLIEAYAKKEGYDIIIGATNVGNVVYAKDGLDISSVIIKELNNRYDQ